MCITSKWHLNMYMALIVSTSIRGVMQKQSGSGIERALWRSMVVVESTHWVLVSEPGFFKVLAHFPGNLILLPEMKPRNNIVY